MSELSVCDVHLCTCARARTHTYTQTDRHSLAQMPHRRSPSQTRTLSLCCCQIKAWKAGHKGDCVAAARVDTRTAAKQTADQMRVLKMLEQLAGAADWLGVAAQERAARAVAVDKRSNARHRSPHGGCHRPGRALLRCHAPPVGSTSKLL